MRLSRDVANGFATSRREAAIFLSPSAKIPDWRKNPLRFLGRRVFWENPCDASEQVSKDRNLDLVQATRLPIVKSAPALSCARNCDVAAVKSFLKPTHNAPNPGQKVAVWGDLRIRVPFGLKRILPFMALIIDLFSRPPFPHLNKKQTGK